MKIYWSGLLMGSSRETFSFWESISEVKVWALELCRLVVGCHVAEHACQVANFEIFPWQALPPQKTFKNYIYEKCYLLHHMKFWVCPLKVYQGPSKWKASLAHPIKLWVCPIKVQLRSMKGLIKSLGPSSDTFHFIWCVWGSINEVKVWTLELCL